MLAITTVNLYTKYEMLLSFLSSKDLLVPQNLKVGPLTLTMPL